MRIVSPYHDYYDCVQALGQDRSLLYLRYHRVQAGELPHYFDALRRNYWWHDTVLREHIAIGFCGTVYPLLRLWEPNKGHSAYCYSLDQVDEFIRTHFRRDLVFRYFQPRHRSYWRETWHHPRHSDFAKFFQHAASVSTQFGHLFDAPVFVYRHSHAPTITYNACLKDYEFYRVVDPYTAYQEIQMWLSNVAAPEKPIPKIDDKTMAAAEGFDKWSFRNEKWGDWSPEKQ